MSYECKTCTEVINDETYYFLWTGQGYLVYHWCTVTKSLTKISSNFFIKLENARTCARNYLTETDFKARLKARIARLQRDLEALGS